MLTSWLKLTCRESERLDWFDSERRDGDLFTWNNNELISRLQLKLCVSCIDATAVKMSAGFPLSHTLTSLFRSRAPTGISPCFCVAHKASAPSHGNLVQRPAANEVLKLFKILLRRGEVATQ